MCITDSVHVLNHPGASGRTVDTNKIHHKEQNKPCKTMISRSIWYRTHYDDDAMVPMKLQNNHNILADREISCE